MAPPSMIFPLYFFFYSPSSDGTIACFFCCCYCYASFGFLFISDKEKKFLENGDDCNGRSNSGNAGRFLWLCEWKNENRRIHRLENDTLVACGIFFMLVCNFPFFFFVSALSLNNHNDIWSIHRIGKVLYFECQTQWPGSHIEI